MDGYVWLDGWTDGQMGELKTLVGGTPVKSGRLAGLRGHKGHFVPACMPSITFLWTLVPHLLTFHGPDE